MENKVFKKNFYEGENMTKEIPNSLLWIFESYDLKNKRYLKDLEFIKKLCNDETIKSRLELKLTKLAVEFSTASAKSIFIIALTLTYLSK